MTTALILFLALIGTALFAAVMTALFAVCYKKARDYEKQLGRKNHD